MTPEFATAKEGDIPPEGRGRAPCCPICPVTGPPPGPDTEDKDATEAFPTESLDEADVSSCS